MNKYELVYIIDAHAPQATREDIAKQVADTAAKVAGQGFFDIGLRRGRIA